METTVRVDSAVTTHNQAKVLALLQEGAETIQPPQE